jgi:hypothetical protein
MKKSTKTILISVGVVATIVTGYLLFFKKDEQSTDAGIDEGASQNSNTDKVGTPNKSKVLVNKLGTSIYLTNDKGDTLLSVSRKISKNNEDVGYLIGFRTINGRVYAMFDDNKNAGKKSLVIEF